MHLSISEAATETLPGVFHAMSWGRRLPEDLLEQLIEQASLNPKRKARLCVHPTSDELLQVTYLAFCRPYSDGIHSHPHRVEVLIPILGMAKYSTFDKTGSIVSSQLLTGESPVAVSTSERIWHAIEVLSESFVMIEIGLGPFTDDSTVYQ